MYLVEGDYGGGNAGAEYIRTPVALIGDLTAFPFPMGEQTLPYMKYEREAIRAVSMDVEEVLNVNKTYMKKEATTKHYLQNKVFAIAAISADAGEPGTSYLIHYEKPEGSFEAFGCVVQEYTLEIAGWGEFPSESVKWHYYDVLNTASAAPGPVLDLTPTAPILLSQPAITPDISFTVDSVAVDLKSLTLTITNEFEEIANATAWLRPKPAVKNRTYSLEMTFNSVIPTLVDDTRTETVGTGIEHDFVITITGHGTFTLNDLIIEECNIEGMPEFGMYEYSAKAILGESSVVTIV